jgi:hypothetical protein
MGGKRESVENPTAREKKRLRWEDIAGEKNTCIE